MLYRSNDEVRASIQNFRIKNLIGNFSGAMDSFLVFAILLISSDLAIGQQKVTKIQSTCLQVIRVSV